MGSTRATDRTESELRARLTCVVVLSVIAAINGRAFGAAAGAKEEAERLIGVAAQAEIAGDNERASALLRDASRAQPQMHLAHWLMGEMHVDNQWSPIEDAQRRAAADPRQAIFRDVRTHCAKQPFGDVAVADWCHRNHLDEEARFYWGRVLAQDPKNKEALSALGLKRDKGNIVPINSPPALDRLRDSKRETSQWNTKIMRWRRAVSGRAGEARSSALSEIRAIKEAAAIAPLEAVTLGRETADRQRASEYRQIGMAFVDALSSMPPDVATESLVRHAVFGRSEETRRYAVKQLKQRDPHDYVPILLDGLAMPIESTVSVQSDVAGNSHYQHSLYQEGRDKDRAEDASYFSLQHRISGRDYSYRPLFDTWEDRTQLSPKQVADFCAAPRRSLIRYNQSAAALASDVSNANQAIEAQNSRIIPVLTETTGEDYALPTQWWKWWSDANEYYAQDHPVEYQYYSGTDNHYLGHPYDTISTMNPSCFVKGTPIWTKAGRRPVETLELGDLVLAQNVDTGELRYEPVIGRTVRPPSNILKISIGSESLRATRGHPFWVAGIGWRMAKELGDGARLHTVGRAIDIRSIEPAGNEEAYNLVVADFNTYFVGEHGFLVHDNTPRRPTRAIVPGVTAK